MTSLGESSFERSKASEYGQTLKMFRSRLPEYEQEVCSMSLCQGDDDKFHQVVVDWLVERIRSGEPFDSYIRIMIVYVIE